MPLVMARRVLRVSLVLLACLSLQSSYLGVDGVVVDGTRTGPHAVDNQKPEEEEIDGYNTKSCGIYDEDHSKSEFVNSAREGQFPWLVSFQVKRRDGSNGHFCMGSFISDKWILSAAHCFVDSMIKDLLKKDRIVLRAGTTNAYSQKDANFTIKNVFVHSKFNASGIPVGFDVALVEVKQKADIHVHLNKTKPFINTVCLPVEGREYDAGTPVKIAGWGDTESKDPNSKPDRLLTTDLLLVDGKKCAQIFSENLERVKDQYDNYKDFICADFNGTRDACQGDSGGSLLLFANQKAVAIGIVSYGLGCATKGYPGIYTRTSSFMPWIKDITLNKSKAKVAFTLMSTEEKS